MQTPIQQTRSNRFSPGRIAVLLVSSCLLMLISTANAQSHREHQREAQYKHAQYERGYDRHRHQGRHQHRQRDRYRHSDWQGERRDRAHRYAQRAVDQAREARWFGYDFNHPRWSTRYRSHFRWALDASRKELRREIRKRERRLREIRSEARFHSNHRRGYRDEYPRQYPRH